MADTGTLSSQMVTQSLNFHGHTLLKWLTNAYPKEIELLNLQGVDYKTYKARQPEISKQTPLTRNELHNFIRNKFRPLFVTREIEALPQPSEDDYGIKDRYDHLPPLEYFMEVDSQVQKELFFKNVKRGDLLYVRVASNVHDLLQMVRIQSTVGLKVQDLFNANIKAHLRVEDSQPEKADSDSLGRWLLRTRLYVEVLEVDASDSYLLVGTKGVTLTPHLKDKVKLGKITISEQPRIISEMEAGTIKSYNEALENLTTFTNPRSIRHLASTFNLNIYSHPSLMRTLSHKFHDKEMYRPLRKAQMSRWAHKSVADGVMYFKRGQHEEAFQCLVKALQIDEENVEAFVAKGALLANLGRLDKAVENFEQALKHNPTHSNARTYICETLVELARQMEEEKKLEEAEAKYKKCLEINPKHSAALEGIKALNKKLGKESLLETGSADAVLRDLIQIEEEFNRKRQRTSSTSKSSPPAKKEDLTPSKNGSPPKSKEKSRDRSRESSESRSRSRSLSPLAKKLAQQEDKWQPPATISTTATFINTSIPPPTMVAGAGGGYTYPPSAAAAPSWPPPPLPQMVAQPPTAPPPLGHYPQPVPPLPTYSAPPQGAVLGAKPYNREDEEYNARVEKFLKDLEGVRHTDKRDRERKSRSREQESRRRDVKSHSRGREPKRRKRSKDSHKRHSKSSSSSGSSGRSSRSSSSSSSSSTSSSSTSSSSSSDTSRLSSKKKSKKKRKHKRSQKKDKKVSKAAKHRKREEKLARKEEKNLKKETLQDKPKKDPAEELKFDKKDVNELLGAIKQGRKDVEDVFGDKQGKKDVKPVLGEVKQGKRDVGDMFEGLKRGTGEAASDTQKKKTRSKSPEIKMEDDPMLELESLNEKLTAYYQKVKASTMEDPVKNIPKPSSSPPPKPRPVPDSTNPDSISQMMKVMKSYEQGFRLSSKPKVGTIPLPSSKTAVHPAFQESDDEEQVWSKVGQNSAPQDVPGPSKEVAGRKATPPLPSAKLSSARDSRSRSKEKERSLSRSRSDSRSKSRSKGYSRSHSRSLSRGRSTRSRSRSHSRPYSRSRSRGYSRSPRSIDRSRSVSRHRSRSYSRDRSRSRSRGRYLTYRRSRSRSRGRSPGYHHHHQHHHHPHPHPHPHHRYEHHNPRWNYPRHRGRGHQYHHRAGSREREYYHDKRRGGMGYHRSTRYIPRMRGRGFYRGRDRGGYNRGGHRDHYRDREDHRDRPNYRDRDQHREREPEKYRDRERNSPQPLSERERKQMIETAKQKLEANIKFGAVDSDILEEKDGVKPTRTPGREEGARSKTPSKWSSPRLKSPSRWDSSSHSKTPSRKRRGSSSEDGSPSPHPQESSPDRSARFGKWDQEDKDKNGDAKIGSSLTEMETFVEVAKQKKLEEMKERNKEFLKPNVE